MRGWIAAIWKYWRQILRVCFWMLYIVVSLSENTVLLIFKKQRFGDWILPPFSSETYSIGSNRQRTRSTECFFPPSRDRVTRLHGLRYTFPKIRRVSVKLTIHLHAIPNFGTSSGLWYQCCYNCPRILFCHLSEISHIIFTWRRCGDTSVDRAQLISVYMKTVTESSLWNVVFWKINRIVFLDKDRTMDNAQKHNMYLY
jgi:hypothetical protein